VNQFPLIKLEQSARLTAAETQAVVNACRDEVLVAAGSNLVTEGDTPHHSTVILEGWACRYKVLDGGKRQIMSFHLPGDWADLHSYFIRTMDHSVGAITDCRVAQIPHPTVGKLIEDYPRLGQLLWRDTMIDSAIFREWVVNIGARDAYQRLSHLLCELRTRLNSLGLIDGEDAELPLTQTDLADAIGVSTVHLNRVLQQLKQDGLVRSGRGSVTITNWLGLLKAGGFNPTYLHLREGPPVPTVDARA
jgi:CRP-like cAMP-binding protein